MTTVPRSGFELDNIFEIEPSLKYMNEETSCYKYNSDLELICLQTKYIPFDKVPFFSTSFGFLGSSMESVRTLVAKYLEKPDREVQWYNAFLGSTKVKVKPSSFMKALLKCENLESVFGCLFFKAMLLWNLQNGLFDTITEGKLTPNTAQCIMLCILSFPSISMKEDGLESRANNVESSVSVNCYPFLVTAPGGPQNINISVQYDENENFYLQIKPEAHKNISNTTVGLNHLLVVSKAKKMG